MKQINNLWSERIQLYVQEMRRYLKYIFNDHLLFVAIFALGGGAYYYNQWVKTLDPHFPIGWVMGLILGLLLTVSPIYTLLKEADIVYLLAIESRMKSYFRKAIVLSFVIQAYILLMVLAAFMPMYVKVSGNGFQSFFSILLILFILKLWNLILRWNTLKIKDRQVNWIDWLIRYALNAVLIFFIIEGANLWLVAVLAVLFLGLFAYFYYSLKDKAINWELLIELEQKRMTAFYRFANLFTDVPKLKGEVKRRRWLDPIFSRIENKQENTYLYLFSRTFIRTSEYFGLYVRLTIIGALILYFSDQQFLLMGVALLFLYLTGFQLIPMVRYHELKIWLNLYPISSKLKEQSFLKVLTVCLFVQSFIFAIISAISSTWINGLYVLILCLVFTVFFVKSYVPGRIRKMNRHR